MKTIQVSWWNLWRNRTRTNVTISAVALCITILIIFQSMIVGLIEKAVFNTTNLIIGEVQIHANDYLNDRSIYKSLKNREKIKSIAKKNNIFTAMDNTWGTPYFIKPIKLGFDMSIVAATKYYSGHSDVMGGSLAVNKRVFKYVEKANKVTGLRL